MFFRIIKKTFSLQLLVSSIIFISSLLSVAHVSIFRFHVIIPLHTINILSKQLTVRHPFGTWISLMFFKVSFGSYLSNHSNLIISTLFAYVYSINIISLFEYRYNVLLRESIEHINVGTFISSTLFHQLSHWYLVLIT